MGRTVRKMNELEILRKPLTKILLVNWSRFGAVEMKVHNSTLFTGVNGSGKSTVLDALTYIISGNTKFNTAANDKDRTVLSYVRGDTKSKGKYQFLRSGSIISYVAMEFYSPSDRFYITVGVCIESADEGSFVNHWFAFSDAKVSDINFYEQKGTQVKATPKSELKVKGVRVKPVEFMKKEKGVRQVLAALGLRNLDPVTFRRKLMKMMCFQLENNIDKFIRESVLAEVEITTIDNLRQQKAGFEKISETYDNIRKRQEKLEEIERKTEIYEAKAQYYHLKQAELYWQEYVISQRRLAENQRDIDVNKEKLKRLDADNRRAAENTTASHERLMEAERLYRESDIFAAAEYLEKQQEDLVKNVELAECEVSRIGTLKSNAQQLFSFVELENGEVGTLNTLDSSELQPDAKYEAVLELKAAVTQKAEQLKEKRYSLKSEIAKTDEKLAELSGQIKRLESNNKDFPPFILEAKNRLNSELEKIGVDAKVRIFAELVEDIICPEWRDAIEAYLGKNKFSLIIDGEYVGATLELFHELKLHRAELILTDKLDDFKADGNSAAELLTIPNIYARRYANYLLGRIYLCNDLNELHQHPLGGLMKDGTLAKGYAVRHLPVERVEYHLGRDAVRLQLEKKNTEKTEINNQREQLTDSFNETEKLIDLLEKTEIDTTVRFEAIIELPQLRNKLAEVRAQLEEQRNAPAFTALMEQYEAAKKEYDSAAEHEKQLYSEMKSCEITISRLEASTPVLAGKENETKEEFDRFILMHLELRKKAIEEYERQSKASDGGLAVSQRVIVDNEREMKKAVEDMENSQIQYCVLADISTDERGVSYIAKFRKEREQVVNIDAERVKQELEEKREELESAFITQFVSAICEALDKAENDIKAINKELKTLPFGQDIYSFTWRERKDKDTFFRIKRKIYDNQLNISNSYSQHYDDDELRRDIKELMEDILRDTGDEEYADYRTYYVYDMNIENIGVSENIEASLSEKQGSASNGEKQTPYFIILAASLMQCYPKNTPCARLAFIDEAFAALSQERIEQMVRYFEQNGFQVMYAAPPEKINSIGSHIDTTVSLIETGRYTNAVEGLLSDHAYI